jgi:PIN domain nuclease of toxin-antitoxin system
MVHTSAEADEIYVSAATAWELGLKVSLGKFRLPKFVEDSIVAAGFTELPVHFRHTREAVLLPPHHQDPFDRMLVARARSEGLTCMTQDDRITQHEVAVLRVP